MPSYLIMGQFTDQGIKNVKETIIRGERFKEMAKECGVEVKQLMWLMGDHDVFCIGEAKNDAAIVTLLLKSGSKGFVKTSSHRAFNKDEMSKIVSNM